MPDPGRHLWLIDEPNPTSGTLLDRLLTARGIHGDEAVRDFLNPSVDRLSEPQLLPDMEPAIRRLAKAVRMRERVLIHGDYDVDGITATAMLCRQLRRLGLQPVWFIPERLNDGYGLSEASLAAVLRHDVSLVVTVDCGVSAGREIAALSAAGIDTLVTDHHACPPELPAACAVVNPQRGGRGAPGAELAGVGVVLQLIRALVAMPEIAGHDNDWRDWLDLAALGTVADVVPLTGDNRLIVCAGLQQIRSGTGNPGIATLLAALGRKPDSVDAQTLGFILGPRLNASGRLGSSATALELLVDDDRTAGERSAAALMELNTRRQVIEGQILEQAVCEIDGREPDDGRQILVVANREWHPGVIGIVAARLADRYRRPTIVLAGEDGLFRGSCRTYGSIDVLAAIAETAPLLIRYGGHPRAAGLTLEEGKLPAFRAAIAAYSTRHIDPSDLVASLRADCRVEPSELNLENARSLAAFEPCGEGNPVPALIWSGATLRDIRQVGNGRHLKLTVDAPGIVPLEAIAFGFGDADEWLERGEQTDLLFSLGIRVWQGRQSPQLIVRDLHPGGDPEPRRKALAEAARLLATGIMPAEAGSGLAGRGSVLPERDDFKRVYQYLAREARPTLRPADLEILARKIARSYRSDLHPFGLYMILVIFQELGLILYTGGTTGQIRLTRIDPAPRVRLADSALFRRLTVSWKEAADATG